MIKFNELFHENPTKMYEIQGTLYINFKNNVYAKKLSEQFIKINTRISNSMIRKRESK